MPEVNDMALVREYVERHSESAFETLVCRNVNLVYAVALRQTGNAAQAEEITQAVFVILARKAARLRPDTVLAAWLHETARYAAASFLRGEARRVRREQEAFMQSNFQESSNADSVWEQLAPLLDEAIGQLSKVDRNAVVLRFFQNKSAREIAEALHVRESAAQKRVNRAVEKLRAWFLKRGVVVSADVLTGALSVNSVHAAPATLAKTVTAVAVAKGAAAPISTLTLIKGASKIMAWTKMKSAAVAGAAILLVAGTATTWLIQHESTPKPRPVDSNQTVFPRSTWRFAGYGTPECAALSMCWALGNHDGRTFRNSLSPAQQKPFAGKPDSAVINEQNKADFAKITGYQILDKHVLSEDEVVLNCYADGLNDSQKFLFLRVGNEWKYNGQAKD